MEVCADAVAVVGGIGGSWARADVRGEGDGCAERGGDGSGACGYGVGAEDFTEGHEGNKERGRGIVENSDARRSVEGCSVGAGGDVVCLASVLQFVFHEFSRVDRFGFDLFSVVEAGFGSFATYSSVV